ncbi:MAG: hypothetical protein K2I80_03225 [Ruminococcus sp.]|nr:hypothetical protein [Ruminococcus sp.]
MKRAIKRCHFGSNCHSVCHILSDDSLAGIADNTYEPYRPSVEEYIADLEARITALEEREI